MAYQNLDETTKVAVIDIKVPTDGTTSIAPSAPGVGECRICTDADPVGDLISPCRCSGSVQWVHRHCLDEWRATKSGRGGRSFTHCDLCQFEFVIEAVGESAEEQQCRRRRFHAYVARDTLGVFLAVQLLICLLGLVVAACDTDGSLRNLFPSVVSDHAKTSYYIWGLVLFLALLGLAGVCSLCMASSDGGGGYGHQSGPTCNGCYFIDCSGCCSSSSSSSSGDDGKAFLVIVLIIIVVLALIGVFVAIFLGTMIVQSLVQRHVKVLWLKQETQRYRVCDLTVHPEWMQQRPSAPVLPAGLF